MRTLAEELREVRRPPEIAPGVIEEIACNMTDDQLFAADRDLRSMCYGRWGGGGPTLWVGRIEWPLLAAVNYELGLRGHYRE